MPKNIDYILSIYYNCLLLNHYLILWGEYMQSSGDSLDSKKIKFSKNEQKTAAYVIGDGPEAHLMAIKLKQKGMQNVFIIGMRFDEFTRSASFNLAVFNKLSESIAPLEVTPSPSRHIKEAERQLHEHAKKLGIVFICGKFICFEKRQLKVSRQEEIFLIPTHPDDIVIDCTGIAHAVLKSINAEHKDKPVFKFAPIESNPHKTYASIRMYFSPDLLNVSNRDQKLNVNPISYALAIEKLRALGWKSYAVPFCHHYIQPSKPDVSKKLEKYVLYFQMPEINLEEKDKAEIVAMGVAKILLQLFRNNPDDGSEPTITLHKKSKRYPKKQNLSVFHIDPYKTTPSHYKGDENTPIVFHAGDATFPMPFVMGKSWLKGIERTESLINAINIGRGLIEDIDYDKYDRDLSKKLSESSEEVEDFFREENKKIEESNKKARELYLLAYHQCKNLEDKEVIKAGLDRLNNEYISELHQNIQLTLEEIADEKTGFKFHLFVDNKHLSKMIDFFIRDIIASNAYLNLSKNNALKDSIHKMADCCKKAGSHLFASKKYSNAIEFYEKAVDLHLYCFPSQFPDELLNLYSNLIVSYAKKDNQEKIIYYADLAKEIFSSVDLNNSKNKLIVEKINFNKANALIQKCKKYSEEKNHPKEIYVELLKQIEFAIAKVANPEMVAKLMMAFELLKQKQPEGIVEKPEGGPFLVSKR